MEKVKIGFVGVGGMGQCAHLVNYAVIPDCEVVAIAEIREHLGRKVAARYGVERVYKSHTEMLAAEKLDAIVASQPFMRHGQIVPDLYKAGVPIFTEKPLAGNIEAAEKMLAALASSKSWHMVGYHKRSDPAIMYAKAEIDRLKQTGELGRMRYVRILMPPGDWVAGGFACMVHADDPMPSLQDDPPASDMDEPTRAHYFSFVNYYIHQVNLMRHLFGESYKATYADPSGAILAVQSESGVAGVIEMAPYVNTIDWQESALVAFEKGYVKIELPAPLACNRPGRVEILRDPGNGITPETIVPTMPWVSAMRQQAINFVKAVKGEMKPICEAPEGLEDLKIARDYIRLQKGV